MRGLASQTGPKGKPPSPKYARKIVATLRAIFKEALRRHVIERTPCQWEDTDLPEPEANSRVIGAGFELAEVQKLIYDPRIPEDRRVLYALEFLTGMRTGEAAARTWADWEPVYRGDLGRLVAGTAYNTRHHVTKTTKTKVEKWLPVHPALAAILTAWKAEGWARFWGHEPKPEDLLVPSATGKPRNVSYSWRLFAGDLQALGIEHQRHYESRSTFINLAEGAGADPDDVARLTHASLGSAKDLYRRAPQLWPRLCAAVRCIQLSPPNGEITEAVTELGREAPKGDSFESNSGEVHESGENGRDCSSSPRARQRRPPRRGGGCRVTDLQPVSFRLRLPVPPRPFPRGVLGAVRRGGFGIC